MTVRDDCFAAGATLTATFESTPVPLGTLTAGADGRYELVTRVPQGASPGLHHVVVTGPNASGAALRSAGAVTVVDLDCSDFPSRGAAQAQLDLDRSDPHDLDGDSDGLACEDLVGGGGKLPRTGSSDHLRTYLVVAGLALLGGGRLLVVSAERELVYLRPR